MYQYNFIFQYSLDGDIKKGNGSKSLGVVDYPYPLKTGDSVTIPNEWLSQIKSRFPNVHCGCLWVGSVIHHIDVEKPSATVFLVEDPRAISKRHLEGVFDGKR